MKTPFKKKTHLCALLEVIGSTSGHIVTTIDDLFLRSIFKRSPSKKEYTPTFWCLGDSVIPTNLEKPETPRILYGVSSFPDLQVLIF